MLSALNSRLDRGARSVRRGAGGIAAPSSDYWQRHVRANKERQYHASSIVGFVVT